MNKRIYMAGSGGMLGDAFYNIFNKNYDLKCTDINIIDDWLSYLDFRDYDKYESDVVNFKPDYLFHLGAYTDLEYCEKNIVDTYVTNTNSVENAVKISNKLNIPLLYISTAGIFDGKKDLYDDYDIPNPICHYARSKYNAELYVEKNSNRYIICRAGWMMGGGPKKDKKFINKIISQIKSNNTTLNVVNDKLGTPTYTMDFARNTELLIKSEFWGTYNLVCEGLTSRLDVTKEILNFFDLSKKIVINEVSSDYFKKEYFAERPNSERLVNFKLNSRSINIMRDWKICLNEYLSEKFYGYLK